jgi:AraC-like DNA-binding protein
MTIVARASDYPPGQRLEYWRTALSEAFVPLSTVPLGARAEPLEGTLRHAVLGPVQVAEVSGSRQFVRRDRALIRAGDPDWIKIGLQLHGCGVLSQDDREAVLTPGEFAAYVTARPYSLAFGTSFRMLVLMCPRSALGLSAAELAQLTAVTISDRSGVGALVSPFLANLGRLMGRSAPPLSQPAGQHLAESILDMLAASLTEAGNDSGALARCCRPDNLLHQIRDYIETNLARTDLSPASIASTHHISVRYLQKLFAREGDTVGGWIRSRRLERCRRDLRDPRLAGHSVAAVAARWGLVDAAYFSRAFRIAYGVTPSEYRGSR